MMSLNVPPFVETTIHFTQHSPWSGQPLIVVSIMVLEHFPGSARALGFVPPNPTEATLLHSNIGDSRSNH